MTPQYKFSLTDQQADNRPLINQQTENRHLTDQQRDKGRLTNHKTDNGYGQYLLQVPPQQLGKDRVSLKNLVSYIPFVA